MTSETSEREGNSTFRLTRWSWDWKSSTDNLSAGPKRHKPSSKSQRLSTRLIGKVEFERNRPVRESKKPSFHHQLSQNPYRLPKNRFSNIRPSKTPDYLRMNLFLIILTKKKKDWRVMVSWTHGMNWDEDEIWYWSNPGSFGLGGVENIELELRKTTNILSYPTLSQIQPAFHTLRNPMNFPHYLDQKNPLDGFTTLDKLRVRTKTEPDEIWYWPNPGFGRLFQGHAWTWKWLSWNWKNNRYAFLITPDSWNRSPSQTSKGGRNFFLVYNCDPRMGLRFLRIRHEGWDLILTESRIVRGGGGGGLEKRVWKGYEKGAGGRNDVFTSQILIFFLHWKIYIYILLWNPGSKEKGPIHTRARVRFSLFSSSCCPPRSYRSSKLSSFGSLVSLSHAHSKSNCNRCL